MSTLSDPVRACARRKFSDYRSLKIWTALALTLLQCVMLFAMPIASCCERSAPLKAETNKVDEDCCPPGSHPPGQCPLHKRQAPKKSSTECRIRCDGPDVAALLFGVAGVLTAPRAPLAPAASAPFRVITTATLRSLADFPGAPPPKTL